MIKADRLAILAEGSFGVLTSKTATCVIRYQPERVVCVIDSERCGLSVQDVLGFGGQIPIVASVGEAVRFSPDSLLIGIAPRGGCLPPEWRKIVEEAIENGLNILSGLHTILSEDDAISKLARDRNVKIWDIRQPVVPSEIASGSLRHKTGVVILTVGSDCCSGKMTVAYELNQYLRERGIEAQFVPTGQTGILLAGWGEAIDRVPGDFMAKVVEDLTMHALSMSSVAIVEGQGSLIHPGYSGVSLAVLHGCCPEAMILCHQATSREIEEYGIEIPSMAELIRIYEEAAAPVFASRVVAIALNTYGLDESIALAEAARVEHETGLPATDVLRWGCGRIYNALEEVL